MGLRQMWMFWLCGRSSKQKDKSVLVLFLLNMEIMEGRCRFVTFNFFVRRRHGPLRMPSPGGRPASVSVLQASLITETSLSLDDGSNMCLGEPSQFGR